MSADDPHARDAVSGASEDCVVEVDGTRFDVRVFRDATPDAAGARPRRPRARRGLRMAKPGPIVAPIPGNVLQVHVANGDVVEAGQIVCIIEAMKMENEIAAPAAGVVAALSIGPGDLVAGGQEIMRIDADPRA